MDPDQTRQVDQLVQELRNRVAERRRAGFYPEGLEQDLEEHFRRVIGRRTRADRNLRAELATQELRVAFSPDRIPLDSALPGGRVVHRAVGMLVRRQTQGILQQMQRFADAVSDAYGDIAAAMREGADQDPETVGRIDAIFERLASYERGPEDGAAAVFDLRRRVEALEAEGRTRAFTAPFTADAFESTFRGSKEELRARYRDLAERLVDSGPVLDIGCGRGEFLELLGELGIVARGIELDAALASSAQAAGLDVSAGDGIVGLAAVPDESLGGIVLLQVIEHLTPQNVVDLIAVAIHKLRPGGVIIVETVNPQSLYVFAHSFYLDPTHVNPVHPAYLKFLFDEAGYNDVRIDWRSPPPADDTLAVDPAASAVEAANIDRLNQLLFAPQDYAVVARR